MLYHLAYVSDFRPSDLGEKPKPLPDSERAEGPPDAFSASFIDRCHGDLEAYYFHEVLSRHGLLESAASNLPTVAPSPSPNGGTTMRPKAGAGQSRRSGLGVGAMLQRITEDINPDMDSQRRERVQRAATAEAQADQEKFKVWQAYKKEKADLMAQGEEVPELLLAMIADMDVELAMRLQDKKAAREAAVATSAKEDTETDRRIGIQLEIRKSKDV